MKSLFFSIYLSLVFCLTATAQRIEAFGGIGLTHFFNHKNDNADYYSYYQQGGAYNVGLGIYSKPMGHNRIGLTARFMKIGGEIEVSQYGPSTQANIKADVKLSTYDLGIYPICINNYGLEFQLGLELSLNTSLKLDGVRQYTQVIYDPVQGTYNYEYRNTPIDENTAEYVTDFMTLLTTKIGYSFSLNNGYELTPRINLGYSLSKRFTEQIRSRPGYYALLLELCLRKDLP